VEDMSPYKKIIQKIQEQYLADSRPWVIGFSGGKDSTCLLQLVFYALMELPHEKLTKEVHVLCNDTLVENPKIVDFVSGQMERIQIHGEKLGLPIKAATVYPKLQDTFWVNLIGRGYPSPNRFFRWCTERMKINPTSAYIMEQVNKFGEVIILLGTRKDESFNRKKSMESYESKHSRLRRHVLPGAYVFAPIADLTTNEVWIYLLQAPSPWNGNNRCLVTLYKNASGECPLVVDTSTPSCGNSRFGCWTCTVVSRDKSFEALFDSTGEDWMYPLLKFRNYLCDIRDLSEKRAHVLRNGLPGKGPFNLETRKEILIKLLQTSKDSEMPLISKDELSAIQVLWYYDGAIDSDVEQIYYGVFQEEANLMRTENRTKRQEDRELLKEVCQLNSLDPELISALISIEENQQMMLRRPNIFENLRDRLEVHFNQIETLAKTSEDAG
jgi:DNA sulfur modification protein DndC